jgi:hypothetical protein
LPDDAGRFIESLSAALVGKGFNIVTGFGLGVGPSVIAGALQEILAHPNRRSNNQLQAFPFPVADKSTPARRSLYRRNREMMVGQAGIAIFLFGNKRNGRGTIVPSDGMREELTIARDMGLQIIAVGSTGWIAQDISKDLAGSLSGRTAAFKKAFAIANDAHADFAATVKAVLTMAKEFSEY